MIQQNLGKSTHISSFNYSTCSHIFVSKYNSRFPCEIQAAETIFIIPYSVQLQQAQEFFNRYHLNLCLTYHGRAFSVLISKVFLAFPQVVFIFVYLEATWRVIGSNCEIFEETKMLVQLVLIQGYHFLEQIVAGLLHSVEDRLYHSRYM